MRRPSRCLAAAVVLCALAGGASGCAPASRALAIHAIAAWKLWATCAPALGSAVRTNRVIFEADEAQSWCSPGSVLPPALPAADALLVFREPTGLSVLAPRVTGLLFDPNSRVFTLEVVPATPVAPVTAAAGANGDEQYLVAFVEIAQRLVPVGAAVVDNGMIAISATP
ncbi:hypothetical protein SAMN05444157_0546 [Frankineae bacterium MT45]|nr:hypothetical protein SAMN05444157_0546 [Frankineae bacterium MT45]